MSELFELDDEPAGGAPGAAQQDPGHQRSCARPPVWASNEAKTLGDEAPKPVKEGVDKAEAEKLKAGLERGRRLRRPQVARWPREHRGRTVWQARSVPSARGAYTLCACNGCKGASEVLRRL
jgi:hypothetical protein